MTVQWTYGDNPSGSLADEVRFLIGDTNGADPLLSDGEVAYVLAKTNDSPLHAALMAAEALWFKFGLMVDQSVGSVSISFSQRVGNLEKILALLRTRVAMVDGVPYGGGISQADVAANNADADRVPPRFYRGVLEPPGGVGGDLPRYADPTLGDP